MMEKEVNYSKEAVRNRIKLIIDEHFEHKRAKLASAIGQDSSKVDRLFKVDKRSSAMNFPAIPEWLINGLVSLGFSREWILSGRGTMTGEEGFSDGEKPHLDLTAAAGSLTEALESKCDYENIIPFVPHYDFTIQVRGDSMEPEYRSGDVVACRKLANGSFCQWGKPHVLATAQGIIIKRIYEDGDSIRCISYNDAYKPFSVPKNEIYDMALVVGLVRLF